MDQRENLEELLTASLQPQQRPFLKERRLRNGRNKERDSQASAGPHKSLGSGSYSSHLRRRRDAIVHELEVFTHLSLAKIRKNKKMKEAEVVFRQFEERSQQLAAEAPCFVRKKSPVAVRQTNLIRGAQGMLKPYNESKFTVFNNLLAQTTQTSYTSPQAFGEPEERVSTSGRLRSRRGEPKYAEQPNTPSYGLDVRKVDFACKTDQTFSKTFMENSSVASRRFSSGADKLNKTVIKIKPVAKYKSRSQKSHKLNVSAYDMRLANYREFVLTLYYCNSVYVDMVFPLRLDASDTKVEVFVGSGNNSALVKRLLKKRWWLYTAESIGANTMFVWTQIKHKGYVMSQKSSLMYQINQRPRNPDEQPNSGVTSAAYSAFARIVHERDQPRLPIGQLTKRTQRLRVLNPNQRVHNHLQFAGFIGNKKSLLKCMLSYYEFNNVATPKYSIPLTYHISSDVDMRVFVQEFKTRINGKNNMWIVKPGENSNRGRGIIVSSSLAEISEKVKNRRRTHIIQEYICNLLLYQRRKFDIRAYCLVTQVNGVMRAYWYQEGYIRTSSEPFTTNLLAEPMVHLTNDAIQKHGPNYGKYEPANKVSFDQFQQYLKSNGLSNEGRKMDQLVSEMKNVTTDIIKASYCILDPNCRENNFQLFGVDFLIDQDFKVWLLEVNTNPCLELCCPLLQRLIPRMLDNALTMALDPLIPMPSTNSKQYFPDTNISSNQFELIFDSQFDRDVAYEQFLQPRMAEKPAEDNFVDAA